MVLPLPLVPFESYMLADDRPAYPMNTFLRLRLSGQFDRTALETALVTAFGRHPLMAARARPSGRRLVWCPAEQLPAIQWLNTAPTESLPRLAPIDVRRTPGSRVAVREGPGQADLILQTHHACSDALGMLAFVDDLLAAYALARGVAGAPPLPQLRPEQLAQRGRFEVTRPRFLRVCPNPVPRWRGARRFLLHTPEPLVPHAAQAANRPTPPAYPSSLTRRLSEARTAEILTAAKRLGVTLNDLLARELFLCLRRWRRHHMPGKSRGWLRLCVPVNLRTPAQDQLPAANVVSMVFLDRRDEDLQDPPRLLASIHDQMQQIKRLGLGSAFVHSVGLCRRVPGLLEHMCGARRCLSTVVFTNLGILFSRGSWAGHHGRVAVDGMVLQDLDVLAPLRPLTCAAFAVWSYARRLCCTLHYDSRVLAEGPATELIDEFFGSILRAKSA